MKFLICYDGNYTQVDEEALTRDLLDKIGEEDALAFRWNGDDREGTYEMYNAQKYVFEALETYSDEEDAEQEERQKLLDGLLKI